MLQKCIDIDHQVKDLQNSFHNYLIAIQYLQNLTPFDLNLCDEIFAGFIGLKRKTKEKNLRDFMEEFHDAFIKLNQAERESFVSIFEQTNDLRNQFVNPKSAIRINDYPKGIQKGAKKLFHHLYSDTLRKYDVKGHYKEVYLQKKDAWCPFCGMEKFLPYDFLKQDYDHFLPKSIYPVSAVNMYNLSPMGVFCNRVHKKAKDPLADRKGNSRRAINPYFDIIEPKLSLLGSEMAVNPEERNWKITFTPNSEEVSTWKDLFNIEDRCIKEFLGKIKGANSTPEVDSLIMVFIKKSQNRRQVIEDGNHWEMNRLIQELKLAHKIYKVNYYHEFNFIRSAIFEFFLSVDCTSYRKALLKLINQN